MKIKKSLVFLLAIAITICMFPISASADTAAGDNSVVYSVTSNSGVITGGYTEQFDDGTGNATVSVFDNKTLWALDGLWEEQAGVNSQICSDVTGKDLSNICGNKFTMTGGYVGDLTCADNTDVILNGGSVGNIIGGKSITLNGGTVRGTISTSGSVYNVGGVSINGQPQVASDPSKIDDISLDTSTATVPMGCSYTILCRTSRTTPPPIWLGDKFALSADTPVKTKGGWLYKVNVSDVSDAAELIIGSKAVFMECPVNARIDTTSVTLPIGAKYGIGVSLHRIDFAWLKVAMSGNAATINHGYGPESSVVYTITANRVGTSYVTFTGPKGNKATVKVVVGGKGTKRSGNSKPLFCS